MYMPHGERQRSRQNDRYDSRQRSRDNNKKYRNKSPSQDNNRNAQKYRVKDQKMPRGKRVKFDVADDIRVFRKEDEPSAKGLSEQEILKIKSEIQKQIAKSYDFNWEHYKHREALSQSHSMKEQKEKEKALSQRLLSAKQQISYFCPAKLVNIESLVEADRDSLQRESHTARIHDILGCYYTHVSEIPNQPQFQILNTNTSIESKIIKFDNDLFSDHHQFGNNKKLQENTKPLKGILKTNLPPIVEINKTEPRQIDPNLIYLLKDFKLNPNMYTKQRTELLLKPYKDSGQLDYLMKNKEVLQALLKNTINQHPQVRQNYQPIIPRQSSEFNSTKASPVPNFTHTFVPKAEKYKTVPCKYFHSPQGCSKTDNCTFIHDQKYRGVPVPNSQTMPTNIMPNQRMPMYPNTPNYGYLPPSMPMGPNMAVNPNYYGQQGGNYQGMVQPVANPYYEPIGQRPYNPQYNNQPNNPNNQYPSRDQIYGMSNQMNNLSINRNPPNYENPNNGYYINQGQNK